ncbi:Trehalose-6-phosphate phosphatase [hydrothermal vent metagenome]|uniref:Trehalose-6-phosphate phosphatase n=1 Tax=hydrothermal vent metagenome TaxID=652676 RepID=A0A3B1DKX9_9ZZZZ
MYIGDDTTDEDAFAVLEGKGFGILVAQEPRKTLAEYWIKDTDEVKKVLEGLLE